MIVKTRFSPSPTGFLHIGGIRTALYSWLFAKKNKGLFFLRIEDTNKKKFVPGSVENIINSLSWLGLNWDQDIVYQSSRMKRYQEIISLMISSNSAYKCYCSNERLINLRKNQILKGKKPRYDKKCRNLEKSLLLNKIPYVIRFKNPDFGYVKFFDEVKGDIIFNNEELDDLIIQRSNGIPTYNFCVVVDDIDMGITHVIRGDDHLSNTPRQINLFKSLGKKIPVYSHLSMILDEKGQKLSKRLKSPGISKYITEGYLPESILNYILRLGWSYKNKEIFSLKDMINLFNLKSISKSPCKLNKKKLLWLNHYYLNNLSIDKLVYYFLNYLKIKKIVNDNFLDYHFFLKNFSKHHNTFNDMLFSYDYLYKNFNTELFIFIKNKLKDKDFFILQKVYRKLYSLPFWNENILLKTLKNIVDNLKISFREIAMPIRMSITGKKNSPGIVLILYCMGKTQVLYRISKVLKLFDKNF